MCVATNFFLVCLIFVVFFDIQDFFPKNKIHVLYFSHSTVMKFLLGIRISKGFCMCYLVHNKERVARVG